MADPYAGQPRFIVMTNSPSIEITDSDCEAALVSEYAFHGDEIPKVDSSSNISIRFRERTATLMMHEANFWEGLERTSTFTMPRFPAGYELYLSRRKDESAKDRYLIGFKADGDRIVFRSPYEFALHAKWLAYGRPEGACGCKYCSGASQTEITKNLKKATAYVKWTNKMDVGPDKRRRSSRRPERRSQREIRKERHNNITFKDYTQGRAATSDEGGPSGVSMPIDR